VCGRFSQAQIAELDRELFKLLEIPRLDPRYNVAPTQEVAIIRESGIGNRSMDLVRWGLMPHWMNDASVGARFINARAETAHEKPAFRDAFRARRCLVPADGFYEWQKTGSTKQPYYIRLAEGEVFAFAGLWDRWVSPDGEPLDTFTILTTNPNDLVAPIHDRMPVILPPSAYDAWLDVATTGPREARDILRPYPADTMTAIPVSRFVNSPKNEGPECIVPVDA
jgi:putative SOS response-associated peptidase YedK